MHAWIWAGDVCGAHLEHLVNSWRPCVVGRVQFAVQPVVERHVGSSGDSRRLLLRSALWIPHFAAARPRPHHVIPHPSSPAHFLARVPGIVWR